MSLLFGPPETTGAGSEAAAPSPPGQPAALRQGGTFGAAGDRDAGGDRSCSVYLLELIFFLGGGRKGVIFIPPSLLVLDSSVTMSD